MRTAVVVCAICALLAGAWQPAAAQSQQAPGFCRNGQGHPTHGRAWCHERNFELGIVWSRQQWTTAPLVAPRRGGDANRATLIDLLGESVVERLDGHGRRIGASGALRGRWLRSERGGALLEVRAGRTPLAEFVDRTGNGRIDYVLVNTGTIGNGAGDGEGPSARRGGPLLDPSCAGTS